MINKSIFSLLLLLFITQWSIGQCILSGNLAFNSNQLQSYINSNCAGETELVIANEATITINAGWDLTPTSITTLRIQGTGSIVFGNSDDITLSSNSSLIIEDPSNLHALNVTGSNTSTIQIIIGTTVYDASVFNNIITSGGVNENGVLEVELTFFQINQEGEAIVLTWETASEDNNWGFEIQRKTNQGIWENIGFVEGQGTTTATTNYHFEDNFAKEGDNYYRLKIIEFDEDFEYSTVVVIHVEAKTTIMKVGPNPAQYYVNISGTTFGTNTVTIYTLAGNVILQQDWEHETTLDISYLPSGSYILENNYNNKKTTQKILVQR